jgi:hypothetical protein
MKVWALERRKQKIVRDVMVDYEIPAEWSIAELNDLLVEPCQKLDLSRPIAMEKHVDEMQRIGRVVFRRADFIDAVPFDSFELEIVDDDKKKKQAGGWQ